MNTGKGLAFHCFGLLASFKNIQTAYEFVKGIAALMPIVVFVVGIFYRLCGMVVIASVPADEL